MKTHGFPRIVCRCLIFQIYILVCPRATRKKMSFAIENMVIFMAKNNRDHGKYHQHTCCNGENDDGPMNSKEKSCDMLLLGTPFYLLVDLIQLSTKISAFYHQQQLM